MTGRRGWTQLPIAVRAPAIAMALAVGLGGCPHHVRVERPYPIPTAAALRAAIAARQRAVTTMNARVRATSWLGGDRVRATVLMLVDRPGRLRLEAEVSLQGTVAVLTTDGERFAFLDARKNELRRGPACPANVASLIRIPLGPADVAPILLGDARLPPAPPASDDGARSSADDRVDWDGDAAADVLDVDRNGGRLRYLIQGASGATAGVNGGAADRVRVVGVTAIDAGGRVAWRAAFEDFSDVPSGPGPAPRVSLPETIRFAEGVASFDDGVELKFKDRAVNEALAATAFSLNDGNGVTVVDVGCPP